MSKQSGTQQNGVLLIDKPTGPTSAGCVGKIKRVLRQKKIGHAGTLDPLATGLLVILLGQGTKLAGYLGEGGKTYSGRFKLGQTTDTYDIEGEVVSESSIEGITEEDVRREIAYWTEAETQIVPPYSAAKHKGKPLYKLAREGKEAPVKVKPLEVSKAETLEVDLPWVRFRVDCGVGTYIRSLVHSLGMRLSCGAVLTELRREHSHPFGLEHAYTLDQVLDEPDEFISRVLPMNESLPHWPKLALNDKDATLVKNGGQLPFIPTAEQQEAAENRRVMFVDSSGVPLALAQTKAANGKIVWGILRGLWAA